MDLMNVLYDKDHYKLALGHVNKARSIVDNCANDYVRMLKYADSLYRSKMLKRAALGRMATLLKKLKPSLAYLEEVRKHLQRLPQIDTNTRTLIITGFPNVGKSSFMNKITNANVDVQDYPFTTQSLFIGHTQFQYTDWQVIDTPGLLDRAISERNTIEMQAITALAHLNACILYFIDISEICGYSIEQQIKLFNSIRVLFQKRPLVIALNKIDIQPFEDLPKETQDSLQTLAKDNNAYLLHMSNVTEKGIADVKKIACELLVDHRLTQKNNDPKKLEGILNRVHVATPKSSDNKARPPIIPDSFKLKVPRPADKKTIKEIQEEKGGAGVYAFPYQEHYLLEDDSWKYDNAPEFFNGRNVADFYDKDIEEKLAELEKEEEYLVQLDKDQIDDDMSDEEEKRMVRAYNGVQRKVKVNQKDHFMKRGKTMLKVNVDKTDLVEHFEKIGIETDKVSLRARKRKTLFDLMNLKNKKGKGAFGEAVAIKKDGDAEMVDANQSLREKLREKKMGFLKGRMEGSNPKDHSLKTEIAAHIRLRNKIEKRYQRDVNVCESDRRITDSMPKHLNSGKRGNGKTDRR